MKGVGLLACAALCACAHLPHLYDMADPLTASDHFRLGDAYEKQGHQEEARRQYERVVTLAPDDPEGWVALGNNDFSRGDLPGAENNYFRALKDSPRHAGALNNLAMTYLAENKNLDEAERLAKTALGQKGPLQPYILDTLAKIYEREGRPPLGEAEASN